MQTDTMINEFNIFLQSKECKLKKSITYYYYITSIINFVRPIGLNLALTFSNTACFAHSVFQQSLRSLGYS